MPDEFWREVVDRVAAEVPGTLLLAEAFWLHGRLLRPHARHAPRVQQRLHEHAARRRERASTARYLKKTIEFDPDILKRYVNFMSNPDERTAIDQFGSGDKYFGVATLMATLPGLPMFGHGQIEGFTEKYGMEFQRAALCTSTESRTWSRATTRDRAAAARTVGCLRRAHNFLLYDFWNETARWTRTSSPTPMREAGTGRW